MRASSCFVTTTPQTSRHLVAVGAADAAFSSTQRRFVVVEGLYADSGDLAPLSDIVNLARQHRWRHHGHSDSCGFAVLGQTGRGSIEHCGLAPEDVDVLVGSLSTTFASVGGFCVGSREVVDHQRLSGAGYCFSASAPPFLCATAVAAISEVDQRGEPQLRVLRDRAAALHRALLTEVSQLKVISAPDSPVQHLLLPVRGYDEPVWSSHCCSRHLAPMRGSWFPALPLTCCSTDNSDTYNNPGLCHCCTLGCRGGCNGRCTCCSCSCPCWGAC